MKTTIVLMMLVALAVLHEVHSDWTFNDARIAQDHRMAQNALSHRNRNYGYWYNHFMGMLNGKRDIKQLETNLDDVVDLDELEEVMKSREARAIMQLADKNGNFEITMDEFNHMVNDLVGEA